MQIYILVYTYSNVLMAVCPNSFVATDIDSSKEKDKTKIHMDIK